MHNTINLSVNNLGKVKSANLEVGDLTIIAGENSSGKSYIVYSLWKAMNNLNHLKNTTATDAKKMLQELPHMQVVINETLATSDRKSRSLSPDEIEAKVKKLLDEYVMTEEEAQEIAQKSQKKNNHIKFHPNETEFIIRALIDYIFKNNVLNQVELQNLFANINATGNVHLHFNNQSDEFQKMISEFAQLWASHELDINDLSEIAKEMNANPHLDIFADAYENSVCSGMMGLANLRSAFLPHLPSNDKSGHSGSDEFTQTDAMAYVMLAEIKRFVVLYTNLSLQPVDPDNPDAIIKYTLHNDDYQNDMCVVNCHLITSERSGAFLFWRDEVNQRLQQQSTGEQYDTKYASPVSSNLDFVRNLAEYSKQESYISSQHPEIILQFEQLMGGRLVYYNKDGVVFQPFKEDSTEVIENDNFQPLPFHLLSSSVRSLAYIYFYIKHALKKGEILIIDEPESFLHPSNQMSIARILAMLVNAGVHVIITTHSDYIIREFNALVALGSMSKLPDEDDKFDYPILSEFDNQMFLKYDKINLYGLSHGVLSDKLTVDAHGLDLYTFNQAMNKQSQLFAATDALVFYDQKKGGDNE